jgi:hypothetical protein
VFVFDNGHLIDDTAVNVAEAHRLALRAGAFATDDTRPQSAEIDESAPESRPEDPYDDAAAGFATGTVTESSAGQAPAVPGKVSVEDTVAELKSLLDAWDTQRVNEAKASIQNTTAAPE